MQDLINQEVKSPEEMGSPGVVVMKAEVVLFVTDT